MSATPEGVGGKGWPNREANSEICEHGISIASKAWDLNSQSCWKRQAWIRCRSWHSEMPANSQKRMAEASTAKKLTRRVPNEAEVSKWIAEAKKLPRALEY